VVFGRGGLLPLAKFLKIATKRGGYRIEACKESRVEKKTNTYIKIGEKLKLKIG